MPVDVIASRYDPNIVALSYLIAIYASYVALSLVKRVRSQDRIVAAGWWACGSLAMGTGIWSMHFVGMLALKLPFELGYAYGTTALSWLAGVTASGVALYIATLAQLNRTRLIGGALVMGSGICLMHYIGMAGLELRPGIVWNLALVGASVAIAVLTSATALWIFFSLRRLGGQRARRWQPAAAVVMGTAICGMHYTGMAAASFALGTVCTSADQIGGASLSILVGVAAIALLTMTAVTTALDAHLQRKTAALAESLQSANTELRELAFRDALTGLPNRLLFDDRVATAVQRSARDGSSLAILFVDLDGFKPVNDSFGHACGDTVLREMATRLAAQARGIDTVARVGGDEFVLLLEGNPDATAAARMASRIIDSVTRAIHSGEHEVRLSCSIGITMYPADGPHEQLLAHADAAMYAAKRAGGTTYAFFEPHMNAGMREQIELQRDLRRALEHGGQLQLHYQPKIDAARGVVTSAEALARWQHPQRGMLSPALFIPVAERFGLIGALGDWVVNEACRQVRAWLDEGLRVRVAINLSMHQLRQEDLVQRVRAALQQHRVDATLITFEVTESVAMDDELGMRRAFEQLSQLGVKLAIDDFGTGYSSLSYLRKLRATQLKIDRSFVNDLEDNGDARAIVAAVVQLAHALGLSVVAEGVETTAQRDVLQALRCDELQGFLFSRPMEAASLARWARRHRNGASAAQPSALPFAESAFLDV